MFSIHRKSNSLSERRTISSAYNSLPKIVQSHLTISFKVCMLDLLCQVIYKNRKESWGKHISLFDSKQSGETIRPPTHLLVHRRLELYIGNHPVSNSFTGPQETGALYRKPSSLQLIYWSTGDWSSIYDSIQNQTQNQEKEREDDLIAVA